MKIDEKYLVFMGDFHYPKGGWNDFKGVLESISSAKDFIFKEHVDEDSDPIYYAWAHIVFEGKIILKFKNYEEWKNRLDWEEEELNED